jgi:hypothetical protein
MFLVDAFWLVLRRSKMFIALGSLKRYGAPSERNVLCGLILHPALNRAAKRGALKL